MGRSSAGPPHRPRDDKQGYDKADKERNLFHWGSFYHTTRRSRIVLAALAARDAKAADAARPETLP
jgi:hypothetical protein